MSIISIAGRLIWKKKDINRNNDECTIIIDGSDFFLSKKISRLNFQSFDDSE
jgi:hypothetical protein